MITIHIAMVRIFVALADACEHTINALRALRRVAIIQAARHSSARWRLEP